MKKNHIHKTILAVYAFFLLAVVTKAQQSFQYSASLDSVRQDGFYRVVLQPAIAAGLQPSMHDIRIINASGRQVPYILKSEQPIFKESKFIALPIVSSKRESDKLLHVVIENNSGKQVSQLLLEIRNTAANRMAALSGSDDGTNWYAIRDDIYLDNVYSNSSASVVRLLEFPASNYHYFQITITGKDLLPLNIVKAGLYNETTLHGEYQLLPPPTLLQKDSSNTYSYVFIKFDNNYFIDQIRLGISGSKFYKRDMEMYSGNIGKEILLGNFVLSQETAPVYEVHTKTDHLLLRITNNDNPPLKIDHIAASQLNRCLYTYLEKGNTYQLVWGDSAAIAPNYDIAAFSDSIGNATALGVGKIRLHEWEKTTATPGKNNWSKWWLWLIIGAVTVLLLFLTFTLTKEINKRAS